MGFINTKEWYELAEKNRQRAIDSGEIVPNKEPTKEELVSNIKISIRKHFVNDGKYENWWNKPNKHFQNKSPNDIIENGDVKELWEWVDNALNHR